VRGTAQDARDIGRDLGPRDIQPVLCSVAVRAAARSPFPRPFNLGIGRSWRKPRGGRAGRCGAARAGAGVSDRVRCVVCCASAVGASAEHHNSVRTSSPAAVFSSSPAVRTSSPAAAGSKTAVSRELEKKYAIQKLQLEKKYAHFLLLHLQSYFFSSYSLFVRTSSPAAVFSSLETCRRARL